MKVFPVLVAFSALALASGHVPNDDDEATVEDVVGSDSVVTVETVTPPEDDVVYLTPESNKDVFFAEHFDDGHDGLMDKKWIRSQAKKDGLGDIDIAKYDGVWSIEPAAKDPLTGDSGLVLKTKAKHAAIAAKLKRPFDFTAGKPFIAQYELNFQNGQDCGGGYIKLLSSSKGLDLRQTTDKTPYTIMFGPDKCGSDSKFHFIFRHINPLNKSIEEKHVKKLDTKERTQFEEIFKDKRPHLFRLTINPDNTYEMAVDYRVMNYGSLLEDFEPSVNPPAEIDDPQDFKPADWDEREKIPDPEAEKPADWDEDAPRQILDEDAEKPDGWLDDEPDMIPDPTAVKPDDWDDDIDGEWEAPLINNPACESSAGCGPWSQPMIDNPAYKGKWYPALINNPNYKGKWRPRKIPNPDYYHDPEPFKMTAIGAVGIELWSMSDDIYFDNILITDKIEIADNWAKDTFDLKVQKLDVSEAGTIRRIINYSNRNPWLYAVYVVVVFLPLVLIVTFCCSSGPPPDSAVFKNQSVEDDGAATPSGKAVLNGKGKLNAHPKKTDAVQDDDEEDQDEDQEEEEDEEIEEIPREPEVKAKATGGARKRKARKV